MISGYHLLVGKGWFELSSKQFILDFPGSASRSIFGGWRSEDVHGTNTNLHSNTISQKKTRSKSSAINYIYILYKTIYYTKPYTIYYKLYKTQCLLVFPIQNYILYKNNLGSKRQSIQINIFESRSSLGPDGGLQTPGKKSSFCDPTSCDGTWYVDISETNEQILQMPFISINHISDLPVFQIHVFGTCSSGDLVYWKVGGWATK